MTTQGFGVCVLTYNSRSVIGDCIASLQAALDGQCHRIVVVDNNSTDDTADFVRKAFSDVHLIVSSTNLGYARGNNLGARHLLQFDDVKYLAFVNPDVRVRPTTLPALQAALQNHPRAGCAGGVAVFDGTPWPEAFRNRPTLLQKLVISGCLRYLPFFGRILRGPIERMREKHYLPPALLHSGSTIYTFSGACFLTTAEAFRAAGGFDPSTFLFQEELILSERLLRAGYQVVAAPDALYSHLGGHSVKRRPIRSHWNYCRSEQRLIREYYRWNGGICLAVLAFRTAETSLFAAYYVAAGMRTSWAEWGLRIHQGRHGTLQPR
jgi:GT2 family glycosyltransferase